MKKNILFYAILFILLISCKQVNQKDEIPQDKPEMNRTRYCFIHDVKMDGDKLVMLFDEAGFNNDTSFSGLKIIEMPNGYFFFDNEKIIEAINVDSTSVIIMQTFSFNDEGNFNFNQKVNNSDLMSAFEEAPIIRYKHMPFRMVSTGTKVDSLIEIYIP